MSIAKMDANGRVLLPIGIRYRLDLNDGDEFETVQLGDGTIILKKVEERSSFKNWLDEKTLIKTKDFCNDESIH
jgi:AbrB family looped-hinge helix DNA binding protein